MYFYVKNVEAFALNSLLARDTERCMSRCTDRDMFMRYLGGVIGHHTVAMDPTSKETPATEDDPISDSEINLDVGTNRTP